MPIPYGGFPDLRDMGYKIAMLLGILIVIYGVLWLLAELNVIPSIFFAIFPPFLAISLCSLSVSSLKGIKFCSFATINHFLVYFIFYLL